MSTRLYKINGEYNTFEYWHNHYGYTRTPTFSVQYKTTNPWGDAFASDGYYDAEDLMDIFTFSFFVPGVVGWYSIDDLALVGYYPAAATELTVARDSEVSNAATLTQDNETYYLVQNDIEYGWMSQAEFEARGWSTDVGDPPSYIVFDTTTGTIVHSIIDDAQMITVYETGVRTESFYFTSNGRNETANTNISHADIPVYLEDGTAPAADTPYDGSSVLAFMDVTGNTKQADGESLYVDNGVLRLDAPDTDEGEQWAALVERIEPAPPLDYNLKVYGQYGGTISLGVENNFMYVFDEPNNRYIMLSGGTSSTIWEIVSIIDTNGNEVSKESDYIWWINSSNIYYKASPTRSVTVAYILLKVTPPIS